jgi:hypothetical protein
MKPQRVLPVLRGLRKSHWELVAVLVPFFFSGYGKRLIPQPHTMEREPTVF